jgi:antitoxin YefM
MHVETFSSTRANLKAVLDRVVTSRAPVKVTRQKAEGVVMVSESEWEAIEETLHLLSSPRNAERLLRAIGELDQGKGEERELLDP